MCLDIEMDGIWNKIYFVNICRDVLAIAEKLINGVVLNLNMCVNLVLEWIRVVDHVITSENVDFGLCMSRHLAVPCVFSLLRNIKTRSVKHFEWIISLLQSPMKEIMVKGLETILDISVFMANPNNLHLRKEMPLDFNPRMCLFSHLSRLVFVFSPFPTCLCLLTFPDMSLSPPHLS